MFLLLFPEEEIGLRCSDTPPACGIRRSETCTSICFLLMGLVVAVLVQAFVLCVPFQIFVENTAG